MLRRLLREENGNVAVLAGIALPALALAAGFAVDHSLLVRTHVELQTTADAAALAGARRMWDSGESETAAEEVAREEAANVIMARRSEATYVISPSASDATVSVSVSVGSRNDIRRVFRTPQSRSDRCGDGYLHGRSAVRMPHRAR